MSVGERPIKSNDLGALLEKSMWDALSNRNCKFWRLHTIRSWKGVSNPCDFIVLDRYFTALLECKATTDEKFSCAAFRQLQHFEEAAKFEHVGLFGVVVYFHSDNPKYVYVGDSKIIENKGARRPIRAARAESYDLIADSVDALLEKIELINKT